MRVALYNQMFGLNGMSFLDNIAGHWAVHYQSDISKIWKRADISKTLETIKKAEADIFGVAEVLEGQEDELKKGLRDLGYTSFYLAKGDSTVGAGRVKVEVVNIQGDVVRSTTTEYDGFYVISKIPLGIYGVRVSPAQLGALNLQAELETVILISPEDQFKSGVDFELTEVAR